MENNFVIEQLGAASCSFTDSPLTLESFINVSYAANVLQCSCLDGQTLLRQFGAGYVSPYFIVALIMKSYKPEVKDRVMHGLWTRTIAECFIKIAPCHSTPPPICRASCTTFRPGSKHPGRQSHQHRFCNDHSQVTCLIGPSDSHFNLTCSINSNTGADDRFDIRVTCTSMKASSLLALLSVCAANIERRLKTNEISYLQSFRMAFPSDQISSP